MRQHLSHWLASLYLPDMGPRTIKKLLTQSGDIEQLFKTPKKDLQEWSLTERQIQAIQNPNWVSVEKTLRWAEADNHHLLLLSDESYPPLLREISDPPYVLFVAGHHEVLLTPQIAMVGSRNASPMGLENATEFAHYLAQSGFTITSGMALGVDGASHRGALNAKGITIGVAGTGLAHVYPRSHRGLMQEMLKANGAIVSEFPLESPPLAYHFPRRNRIISGLSLGVLVVEAALKSGSLITVKFALEQGREVFAIPGSIHHSQAKGCHYLIRQGAKLVEEAKDIVEELGGFFEVPTQSAPKPQQEPGQNIGYLPNAQAILALIGYEMTTLDMIVCRSGLTLGQVSSILLHLELNGYIQSVMGGYVRLSKN